MTPEDYYKFSYKKTLENKLDTIRIAHLAVRDAYLALELLSKEQIENLEHETTSKH